MYLGYQVSYSKRKGLSYRLQMLSVAFPGGFLLISFVIAQFPQYRQYILIILSSPSSLPSLHLTSVAIFTLITTYSGPD